MSNWLLRSYFSVLRSLTLNDKDKLKGTQWSGNAFYNSVAVWTVMTHKNDFAYLHWRSGSVHFNQERPGSEMAVWMEDFPGRNADNSKPALIKHFGRTQNTAYHPPRHPLSPQSLGSCTAEHLFNTGPERVTCLCLRLSKWVGLARIRRHLWTNLPVISVASDVGAWHLQPPDLSAYLPKPWSSGMFKTSWSVV